MDIQAVLVELRAESNRLSEIIRTLEPLTRSGIHVRPARAPKDTNAESRYRPSKQVKNSTRRKQAPGA
jgi:hypothetical protein